MVGNHLLEKEGGREKYNGFGGNQMVPTRVPRVLKNTC